MLNLLLVPLDRSIFAEQALPHAVVLARRADAKLKLICVRSSLPLDNAREEQVYLDRMAAQLEPELPGAVMRAVLTDELGPLHYAPPVSNVVADVISHHAQELNADMIVMATHGRGGVRRAWLGSVADSLIRIASRPVLLIRPKDEAFGSAASADRGFRHIVIAVDGSDTAEQVIPYALSLGSGFGARYSVVRVVSPLIWGTYETVPLAMAPPLSRRAALEYVEQLATRVHEQGAQVSASVIEAFSPGPAIVEYAETHGADAIAVSTAGAGRVRRMLLGSVTDKVVRGSDIPVLVCNIRQVAPITESGRGLASTASGAPASS